MSKGFVVTQHTFNDSESLTTLVESQRITVGKFQGDVVLSVAQGEAIYRLVIPGGMWPTVERLIKQVRGASEYSSGAFAAANVGDPEQPDAAR